MLDRFLEKIVTYLMVLIVATVILQIAYRYIIVKFTQYDLSFTDELARYTVVWITYLAIGLSYKEGMQVAVDVIHDRLSPKNQVILRLSMHTLMMFFNYIVIVKGIPFAMRAYNFTTPTMEISQAWLYIAPVVGGILLSIHILLQMANDMMSLMNPSKRQFEGG